MRLKTLVGMGGVGGFWGALLAKREANGNQAECSTPQSQETETINGNRCELFSPTAALMTESDELFLLKRPGILRGLGGYRVFFAD